MHYKIIQPDNPILHAEISYQQRILPRWLRWFDRFGVIVLALIISLALLIFPLSDGGYGVWWLINFIDTLVILLWITQLLVIIRCIFAGINGRIQHKTMQQWDVFILTGITTKQILIGEFWGALYQVRGWIVAFGIINLAVAALLSTNLAVYCYRVPVGVIRQNAGYSSNTIISPNQAIQIQTFYCPTPRTTSEIILIVSYTVALSVLGVMGAVAVGLIGSLFGNRAIGFIAALLLRFVPVVVFTLRPDYPNALGVLTFRWYEYTLFSLADGAAGILRSSVIRFTPDGYSMTLRPALLAFWLAIILFIAYLLCSFIVSTILLRRQGVLFGSSK